MFRISSNKEFPADPCRSSYWVQNSNQFHGTMKCLSEKIWRKFQCARGHFVNSAIKVSLSEICMARSVSKKWNLNKYVRNVTLLIHISITERFSLYGACFYNLVNFWFHLFPSIATLTHIHTHRLHWGQDTFSRWTRFILNTLFQISRRNKISRDQKSSQFKLIRETTVLCKYYFWVTGENENDTKRHWSRLYCYANQCMLHEFRCLASFVSIFFSSEFFCV